MNKSDASYKSCPNSFRANNWAKWNEFKSALTSNIPIIEQTSKTPQDNVDFIPFVGEVKDYNAIIENDFFYTRDINGNKDGGRIDISDKVKILDVLYSKQLVYVEYPVPNGTKKAYITNATNCINYIYQSEWCNGSSNENVYEIASKTNKIGILSPYEKATPLYRENGMLHVVYDTDKGKNTKSGFVAYDGNFNKL